MPFCGLCSTIDIHALVFATAQIDLSRYPPNIHWPVVPPAVTWHRGQGHVFFNARSGACALCALVWRCWTTQFGGIPSFEQLVTQDPNRGGQLWITPKRGERGVFVIGNTPPPQLSMSSFQNGGAGAQAALANRMRAAYMQSWSVRDAEVRLLTHRGQVPRGYEEFFGFQLPPHPFPASVDMARHWLSRCLTEHTQCRTGGGSQPPTLPTRVIDVGVNPQGPQPYLLVADRQTTGQWAALSYCWGGANTLVLTKAKLPVLRDAIPMAELPRTLQDAIFTTHRLGLRYVWIDALCIVQDDPMDWAGEAARMADIYHNAVVTLSATASATAKDGMLLARPEGPGWSCQLPWHNGPQAPSSSVTLVQNGAHRIDDGGANSIEDSPMSKRAWCTQEALLSMRTLYFTSGSLVWECATLCEDELGWTQAVQRAPGKQNKKGKNPSQGGPVSSSTGLARGSLFFGRDATRPNLTLPTWQRLVSWYTERSLTNAADILPALGGMAAEMAPRVGGLSNGEKYYAGLWGATEAQFVDGMLWWRWTGRFDAMRKEEASAHLTFDSPIKPSGPPPQFEYLAPSWSWASIQGRGGPRTASVVFGALDVYPDLVDDSELPVITEHKGRAHRVDRSASQVEVTRARVVSVATTPTPGSNRFGRVAGGHATLEGRFRRVPPPAALPRGHGTDRLLRFLGEEHYPHFLAWDFQTGPEREFAVQHRQAVGPDGAPQPQGFALLELARWQVKYPRKLFGKAKPSAFERSGHAIRDNGSYLMVLESLGAMPPYGPSTTREAGAADGEWRRIGLLKIDWSEGLDEDGTAASLRADRLKGVWEEVVSEAGDWQRRTVTVV